MPSDTASSSCWEQRRGHAVKYLGLYFNLLNWFLEGGWVGYTSLMLPDKRGRNNAFCVFPIKLTWEGESVFLVSKKALLLSGSRSKSAADRSMMREWSFWKTQGRTRRNLNNRLCRLGSLKRIKVISTARKKIYRACLRHQQNSRKMS